MANFDSKAFNPQVFGAYVNRIPNVTKTELARSGAVGTNAQAKAALSNQTGSLYARIPYFGRIICNLSRALHYVSMINCCAEIDIGQVKKYLEIDWQINSSLFAVLI